MEGENTAKPKLTKEEKKALKAEKKRQKLEQKEALLTRIKKQDLDKEIKLSKVTTRELERKWKHMCLEVGVPEMRNMMYETWHCFTEAVNKKDWLIDELLDQWGQRQDIINQQFQTHVFQLDGLLHDFNKDITQIRAEYIADRDAKLKIRDERKAERTLNDSQLEVYIKTIIYQINTHFKEATMLRSADYITRLDEEINKGIGEIDRLSIRLESKLLGVWNDYKNTLNEYEQNTEERITQMKEIYGRDMFNSLIIRTQLKKLESLAKRIEHYKEIHRAGGLSIRAQRTLFNLRKEKERLWNTQQETRALLNKEKRQHEDLIKVLAVVSNKAIDRLQCIHDKGDKIIRLKKLCSIHQTIQECERKTKHVQYGTHLGNTKIDVVDKMAYFWTIFCKVEKRSKYLVAERKTLRNRNKQLEEHIKDLINSQALPRI